MKSNPVIPPYIHHALWACDIASLDLQRDERFIITQVLNRGGAKAVRWLRQTYGDSRLATIVQDPSRGLWFPQVLNFWMTILGVSIQPEKFKRAVFEISSNVLA